MKVAITGVSGYLGQLLLRRLAEEPAVESILGLDAAPSAFQSPKLTFEQADVRTAPFAELFKGRDVVYHLAFIVEPRKNMRDAEVDEINIGGSERVFRGAAAAGVSKVIYSSSCAAYGAHPDNPAALTEDSPLRPNQNWYYSRTKGAVERFLDEFQQQHPALIIIRFRPSIFLGPSINNSVAKLYHGRLLISIDRTIKTDLCWDEDIVEAFFLALNYPRSDVFNLTGGGPLTMDEVGAILGRRVLHVGRPLALGVTKLLCALRLEPPGALEWIETGAAGPILVSTERARERLGWQPRFDSAATLRKYVDSLH